MVVGSVIAVDSFTKEFQKKEPINALVVVERFQSQRIESHPCGRNQHSDHSQNSKMIS